MHIFLAGASGTIGHTLIPYLISHGHTVTGTTRSNAKAGTLRALGAEPAIMDGLDAVSVLSAVEAAKPDAILHEMTALSGMNPRQKPDRIFEVTNRLRIEGTEHLLAAARSAGVERFVAQSYAGWPAARSGGAIKSESDPLDPEPPKGIIETHTAIRRLEEMVTAAGGIVLRYGGFYGPGSGITPDGDQTEMIRKRKFPLVGDGGGVWSFIHTDDAAAATLAALERGRPGQIYNVVDDEPAPVREWLPALADILGAKPPRHVPTWLARTLAGPAAVMMMTDARGASNAKARAELDWTPSHRSWREGFREAVTAA
jgi:nucleoside-diphosphate-sugar epimerase